MQEPGVCVPKIALSDVPARILFINCSPRGGSNSQALMDQAIQGALSVGNVVVEEFRFRGKKIAPCTGCVEYCGKNKKCVHVDDFVELSEAWVRADGIVWATPVYTFGPPSPASSWMERFGEIFFQNMKERGGPLIRFAKPTGVLVQGSSRFGGQELVAQAMAEHVLQMDCIPVSGDMPHDDQGVLGQVVDKHHTEEYPELLQSSYRMGVRVAEMTKLVKLGKLAIASSLPDIYWYSRSKIGQIERPTLENLDPADAACLDIIKSEDVGLKILAINGSPRAPKRSNSQVLLEQAKAGALQVPGVEIAEYSFARQKIDPCRMCIGYCSSHEECCVLDDFQDFRGHWLDSDGAIWSVPIYHMGPPSIVRAALDRMNELRFQTSRAHQQQQYPRLLKAVGAIIQGGSAYGGQEISQQYFLHHSMLLQCVPVTADMPESYLGVGVHVRSREDLLANEGAMRLSLSQGLRVAEMAKIIKAGRLLSQDSLPDEYFPSREKMGLIERRPVA